MKIRRRPAALVVVALVTVALGACSSRPSGEADEAVGGTAGSTAAASSTGGNAETESISGDLTVFAAASLKGSFDELVTLFEERNPNVTVKDVVYDGSSTLATQLIEGAYADVFATADTATMDKAKDSGLIDGTPDLFASNTLQIAVAPGNPKNINALADLSDPSTVVVLCAPEVPCGAASQKALLAAGVSVTPASEEQNVKAVVTKVSAGEADAGLVYATDVSASSGGITGVDFPEASQAVNHYPIATLASSKNSSAAQAFKEFVLSQQGQQVMASYGFARP